MSGGSAQSSGKGGGSVAWLVPRDRLPRDDEQLRLLVLAHGEAAFQRTLSEAREELAFRLATLNRAGQASDFDQVRISARRLRRVGTEMGFPTLTNAADNVLACLAHFDAAALGATLARLHRLGIMALSDLTEG